MAKLHSVNRREVEKLVYQHMSSDYRSMCDGEKCILAITPGGATALVPLSKLTYNQLLDNLPSAVRQRYGLK